MYVCVYTGDLLIAVNIFHTHLCMCVYEYVQFQDSRFVDVLQQDESLAAAIGSIVNQGHWVHTEHRGQRS